MILIFERVSLNRKQICIINYWKKCFDSVDSRKDIFPAKSLPELWYTFINSFKSSETTLVANELLV